MEVAGKYNIPAFDDYQKMIKSQKLDAVSICVPTSLHYLVAKNCINNGLHVLLEKPIASTVKEGEKLLELASSKKIKFLVGHIERFNPVVKKAKEMIENDELGKVITIIARRVGGFPFQITDTNVSVDSAIHDIDIANYLLGRLPTKVYSHKQRNLTETEEDSCDFLLDYDDCCVHIQTNWITPIKIRKIGITGTRGYLELDYIKQSIVLYKSSREKVEESDKFSDYLFSSESNEKIIVVRRKEPLKEEITYFIDCIRNNEDIDSRFAVQALNISLS